MSDAQPRVGSRFFSSLMDGANSANTRMSASADPSLAAGIVTDNTCYPEPMGFPVCSAEIRDLLRSLVSSFLGASEF